MNAALHILRLFEPTFAGIEAVNTPQLHLPIGDTMDNDQERDFVEERYNAELCPLCDHSPCIAGAGKGSCDDS